MTVGNNKENIENELENWRKIGKWAILREIQYPDFEFIKPIYAEQRKILTRKLQEAMMLPEESAVVVCQNPKCRRQIEEPILLNNISVTPAEQYDACPHCFAIDRYTRLVPVSGSNLVYLSMAKKEAY